tara:strand:+ start:752 stop:1513 length:762 start_codon:yes stop_codon:yes gene_type:complete
MKNQHDPPAPAPSPSLAQGGLLPALDSSGTLRPRESERLAASCCGAGEEREQELALCRLAEDWLWHAETLAHAPVQDEDQRKLLLGELSTFDRRVLEEDIQRIKRYRPRWKKDGIFASLFKQLRDRSRDVEPVPGELRPLWYGFDADDVTKAYGFYSEAEARAWQDGARKRVQGPGFPPEPELGAVVMDDAGARFELLEDGERVPLIEPSEYARQSGSGSLLELFKTAGAVALATVAGVAAAVTTNGNEWGGP